ncbi:MAG TPA: radical SAM family heme chaperone HemW [Thermoanaerobaculia bacterium]|nr:radical SAM family heme chaperone HemW [Thermoanaerobaculia bacterium]
MTTLNTHAGLYLHVPFCSAICPYCDFAVVTGGRERRARFVDRLVSEIGLWAGEDWQFDTVYFGGGTPSALAAEDLARIVAALRHSLAVRPDAWLFLEANPEDVTAESLAAWRGLGVRTLSLGVQSFDPAALRFLGRRHDPAEARRAVELARGAGFDTVSIDLIYGLPGQDATAWRAILEAAVGLGPDHLSCYQLTVHEGTPFGRRLARGALRELPEPAQAELFDLTHAFLAGAGYPAYEVSSFARSPAHRSRHNQKYWDHTPYLGLGPSAHSFAGARRWWNERQVGDYEARVAKGERPVAGGEDLGREDLALEALMLGLRTTAGIDLASFRRRYGTDLAAANAGLIARLVEEGFLSAADGRLAPTSKGLAVADSLARGFEIGLA